MKTLKILLPLSLALALSFSSVKAQSKNVKWLIDTTIRIMQKNAANAKTVNWAAIRTNALKKASGINDPYDLGPVMRYIFQSIDDFHGAFFYKDSTFKWTKKEVEVPDSFMNEWKKGPIIKTALFDDSIGYLRMPSMMVASKTDFYTKAQQLSDSLCKILEHSVKGLILDLRLNGGGAMHPMILGVEALLGDGKMGAFHTNTTEYWYIRNHRFYIDSIDFAAVQPKCIVDATQMPVIMLVSPFTGSSAECLIIAFKGRKNTVLLGSATAGYVTINNGFQINDTAFLNLSVGYSADRSGKIYKAAIPPDIPFESIDSFNDPLNDEKVKVAMKWIYDRQ